MFRKILAFKLRLIAKLILKKYKPKIVAITGSVGKSSTKEAIFTVLAGQYRVRKSEGNYNTDIGVPLTIIGARSAGRNIFGWIIIFLKGLALVFFKKSYPEILVLEMGADRVGDLAYLTSFVKPDISVVTSVGISHLEFFGSKEAIRREKGALVRALGKDGAAILNKDDEGAMSLQDECRGKVITYGQSAEADFNLTNVDIDKSAPLPLAYSFLAAVAVGERFGIAREEALKTLRDFQNLPGRLQIIPGINGSTIIDDTYNSAPASAVAALRYLQNHAGQRKIAVLGKMAELGQESEAGHRQVGSEAAKLGIDFLFVKSHEAALIRDEAIARGLLPESTLVFADAREAAEKLKAFLQPGDVVLVKASQSDYFEDVIKEILADPRHMSLLIQRDYTRPR